MHSEHAETAENQMNLKRWQRNRGKKVNEKAQFDAQHKNKLRAAAKRCDMVGFFNCS